MKVLPKAETEMSLVLLGLSNEQAVLAMSKAMGTSAEVSGAAHMPATNNEKSQTCLRLDGFAQSVDYRINKLADALAEYPNQERMAQGASKALWSTICDCKDFVEDGDCLWRISCTPKMGAKIVSAIEKSVSCKTRFDWQGGLIWLASAEPNDQIIRDTVAANGGGHATLLRHGTLSDDVAVFQPQPKALQNISRNIKDNFDPKHILNPGKLGVW